MAHLRKPSWLKKRTFANSRTGAVLSLLKEKRLHTVCQGAGCPNLCECFDRGIATFMIMGDVCTRACRFCGVNLSSRGLKPAVGIALAPPSPDEPQRVAEAVARLKLKHAVVTSVTRDDLEDGGAAHFAATIRAIRELNPGTMIEVLTPDFKGDFSVLSAFEGALPDIFNHNLETVPSLYHIRPGASYARSLGLLLTFKTRFPAVMTKSGLMAGLGETRAEICSALEDLRRHRVDSVTLGQYLNPSVRHEPVREYVTPGQFEFYEDFARTLGFTRVFCGPFVRSSYRAGEMV
jgi:lipoic acid synthetase